MPDATDQPTTGGDAAPSEPAGIPPAAELEAEDRPVDQAGIVVGHRADDEPILTDRDPDPTRQEPTTTDSTSTSTSGA